MNLEEQSPQSLGDTDALTPRAERIAKHVLEKYGPVVYRDDLVKLLGFANHAAFDRACQRGNLNLLLMKPPNRRGVCADVWDVARHLAEIPRELPGSEREVDK